MNGNKIPLFGARKFAKNLIEIIKEKELEINDLKSDLKNKVDEISRLGISSIFEKEKIQNEIEEKIKKLLLDKEKTEKAILEREEKLRKNAEEIEKNIKQRQEEASTLLAELQKKIVSTEDLAILQEAGVYQYRHPLSDAVAYKTKLDEIQERIKSMARKDGGAVLGSTSWTVNGSEAQGRKMVADTSKLMLRAFNAESDNLVRTLKPYKLDAAIERLTKVAETIERLGKTMNIRISYEYMKLRIKELELTSDFLRKEAEEKQAEREEKERLREERKAQIEMERERARLDKERQHYENAMAALITKGDTEAVSRMQEKIDEVQRAIEDVDYRTANIRAGYVYVVSNIGSFGEKMVKIGMTRRLDPMDRIRELGDASVPFNFDVHALFFSTDAVKIETTMHQRLAHARVNQINLRRKFFNVTPLEAKTLLAELAGDLLQFQDVPDATEYRESLSKRSQTLGLDATKIM